MKSAVERSPLPRYHNKGVSEHACDDECARRDNEITVAPLRMIATDMPVASEDADATTKPRRDQWGNPIAAPATKSQKAAVGSQSGCGT
jgi:hypothetical protein